MTIAAFSKARKRALLLRAAVILVVLAAAGVTAAHGIAFAHARYVRSEPAFGATLTESPARVTTWFSQELAAGSRVKVISQTGQRVDDDNTRVPLSEPKSMTVGLKPLSPGTYLVEWESISLEDQEAAEGSFTFSLAKPGTSGGADAAGGFGGALPIVSLAVSAVALAVALWALRRSNRAPA